MDRYRIDRNWNGIEISHPAEEATMRRLIVVAFLLAACSAVKDDNQTATTDTTTIEAKLPVHGGSIWYRVVGHGTGTPAILLHGGPGFSSFYLKALEELGDERRVVRYDQLGGGHSDAATDTAMFNIAHFVAELDSLRTHLGYDVVHILGHSWGTILGLEYYRAHPEHVKSLVLMSPALDIPEWERHARELLLTLPDSSQLAVREAEAAKKYDDPKYQAAIGEFYSRYVWRKPVQADLDSMFATVNMKIYEYMQGPSEFTIIGTLKSYNSTTFLKDVKVPTLFTVGEFDEANPETVKRHAAMTPGAEVAVLAGAAHLTQWDAREENIKVVREFLRKADQKK
jgi:proline-specific peptidase